MRVERADEAEREDFMKDCAARAIYVLGPEKNVVKLHLERVFSLVLHAPHTHFALGPR